MSGPVVSGHVRPAGLSGLANRYSAMRHGQSKANAAGIIVSRIETDRAGDYGLTAAGREQALAAARACALPPDTLICSSDFARARQTAELVRASLGAGEVLVAAELRERCFGAWECTPVANYQRVWDADESGTGQDPGVEPAAAVLGRAAALVTALEARYAGREVLLVSHGDPLAILQAGFAGLDPAWHRRLPPLGTAQIRRLSSGGGAG